MNTTYFLSHTEDLLVFYSGMRSYRDLEEMAGERGLEVDHTTIYRWVIKSTPELEKAVRLIKRPAGKS